MHNGQSSLSSAGNLSGKGVDLDLLCALAFVLAAQATGATKTIMSNNMIASQAQHANAGVCTPRMMMMDITISQTRAIAFSILMNSHEVIHMISTNSYGV
jgi:hypothetical protein